MRCVENDDHEWHQVPPAVQELLINRWIVQSGMPCSPWSNTPSESLDGLYSRRRHDKTRCPSACTSGGPEVVSALSQMGSAVDTKWEHESI